MNTTARRDRILGLLHRGATTVPAIAAALGVTDRTVYRDILALRNAGHTIQATPGRGGGVRLCPDSRPRPVHFEVSEIIGLALSVAVLKAMPRAPFAESAQAALDRARQALSSNRQRALRRLERRILIGRPASEATRTAAGPLDKTLLPVFERCFTGARQLTFDYVDSLGVSSTRRVECIALVLHSPVWYIVAWDLDKQAPRLFRMDRISSPTCGDVLVEHHPLALEEILDRTDEHGSLGDWVGSPIA